jgi:hypothetical protein
MLLVLFSCSHKKEKQDSIFSFELNETIYFTDLKERLIIANSLFCDSLINIYNDSLKITANSLINKIKFENKIASLKRAREGYLFNNMIIPYFQSELISKNGLIVSPIIGFFRQKDTLLISNFLNRSNVKRIFTSNIKWELDSINKFGYLLLLLKNKTNDLKFSLDYISCFIINENKNVLTLLGDKAYYIKVKMNDKFKTKMLNLNEDQYFAVKIKFLDNYSYFVRSVKQLKSNDEFVLNDAVGFEYIQKARNRLKQYNEKIICP